MDDQVKNAILNAAMRLFQRFGYKKTTIEEIARAAQIGKGTVYLHFASKEEIFMTLVQNHLQEITEEWIKIVSKKWPPDKKVSAMLRSCISTTQRKKEELSLATLPTHLVQSVIEIAESSREQRLALLSTVLDPLFATGEDRSRAESRNKLAEVLLEQANNILFRLDMDKNFCWEKFLDASLELLLPTSEKE